MRDRANEMVAAMDNDDMGMAQEVIRDDNEAPAGWDRAETACGDWDAPR